MQPSLSPHPRILVIEDDVTLRESLAEVLMDEGFEVRTAHHGRAALGTLRDGFRPDLILLDLMMPVMDGWQFRNITLDDPALARIPVVVTTALSEEYRRDNRLQAAAYLTKPILIPQLLREIASHALEGQIPGDN